MKRVAIVIVVMLVAASCWVSAGPYFTLENTGTAIAPTFTGGVDFSFALQSGSRVFGDTHWALPTNDWTSSLGIGVAGAKAVLGTTLDFNRRLSRLNTWDTSFTITGYPFQGFRVWGGVSFNYAPRSRPTWALVPVFGIEGRW